MKKKIGMLVILISTGKIIIMLMKIITVTTTGIMIRILVAMVILLAANCRN